MILSAMLLVSSCSMSGSGTGNTIKFLWFGSEEETKVIKKIVNDFEKQNPNIKVVIQMVEWLRFNEKLLTMLLGRRAPDISRMSVQWCRRYAELGAFADISDMIPPEELADFVESRLASCRYKGCLFGLPHSSIGLMMFYNADVVEKAGITLPATPEDAWSWDEFEENSRKAMEKCGIQYGWSTYRGWFPLLIFFYQNGGRIFDDTLTHSTFAREENIEALKWFIDQHRKGVAPSSAWTGGDPGADLFMRGFCAFHISGNWSLVTFSKRITGFQWDVTYLPRQKRRATNVGGENLVIFNTRKKAMAVKLLRFLTSKEQIARFSRKALFIPTRKSLLTPEFRYEKHNELMQKFIIQSKDFESAWAEEQSLPAFSELEKGLLKNVELAILGQSSPEQALQNVDKAFENLKK
ncbi:sugar ABC transporter substrate-binding protein [Candidatus Sumerlaeota bacterium]|nr:sugar ABC transporter substrate-binding protein [Candidatus Sumerlaeota bacterium]